VAEERDQQREIEIAGERASRWSGWIGWAAMVLAVAGLIAWLLGRFTGSVLLAMGLVAFMLIYMLAMAWFASRKK
jgi:hypothetical protein